ncbi:hypothetical protein ACKVWL_000225 [Pyricularia oryzae]
MHLDSLTVTVRVSIGHIATIMSVSLLRCRIGEVIYWVYFTPFPRARLSGPKLWAAMHWTLLFRSKIMGTMPTDAVELHKKCGKMVRIGTDKVMVDGSIAWSRVHQRQPNQPQFGKYPAVYGREREL